MKATDELKNEHQGIGLMLRVLQAVSAKLGRGEQVQAAHLDGIMEFLTIFVDRCHHGKEEEFLFPALEAAGVPHDGGPIGILIQEHEQGRKLVARLKGALGNIGKKSFGAGVQAIVDEYATLLGQHIGKENTVLFPMAEGKLDSNTDTRLFEAFERLERERIGIGKHEEFHELLHQLSEEYLN